MTQYSREGGKDFELQGDTLVPVMNSDVSVAFHEKWASMMRDSGPANWTNYFWYEVGTDLGAGKAAMIYDATSSATSRTRRAVAPKPGTSPGTPGRRGADGSYATNHGSGRWG
jgi:multiple sugar transport system substrate-binding protein